MKTNKQYDAAIVRDTKQSDKHGSGWRMDGGAPKHTGAPKEMNPMFSSGVRPKDRMGKAVASLHAQHSCGKER